MARRTLIASLLLLAFGPAGACSCEDEVLSEIAPGTCEPTFTCQQGFTYRGGECRIARCQGDTDCCPGQRCSVAAGLCVDQWKACSEDSECGEIPGQRCIDFRGGQFCGYPNRSGTPNPAGTQGCSETAECPTGTSCVGRRCLVAAPCAGGCPNGQVCDLDSNTCFELPSCMETCTEGQILVVADPDSMSGEACCLVECACTTLPPVPTGQYGWHASLVAADGAFVSAYDTQYGDLVVASFDSSGQPTGVEYVDGFPDSGPIVANPSGRRNGRAVPGPDVGEYTSIARDNAGNLHVAYYDRSAGNLKYARRSGGRWSTHTVDSDGDVGRFTSIAIGPAGRPRIAYMVVEAIDMAMGGTFSALRYAEAQSSSPTGSAGWTLTEVDRRPRIAPTCGGGCERNEACVDFGAGAICAPTAMGCSGCGTGEACVTGPAGPECQTEITLPELDELPLGTGLFASLVLTSTGTPFVAFYDRVEGDLKLATRGDSAAFRVRTLDGNDPLRPTDVGAHVSAALDPNGRLALAYMDFTADDLIYLEPSTGVREVVDDGVSPPDLRMVGADASLTFDPSGAPAIAYQDGTRLDLVYARRQGTPPMWNTEVLIGGSSSSMPTGAAAGFYATQGQVDGRAYIASVTVGFDASSSLQLQLRVDVRSLD